RAGRGAFERVDHDQQLHQVVVGRRAGRLHDEAVHAPDVLVDLDVDLTVGEARDLGAAERRLDVAADRLRQLAVGVSAEYGEGFEHDETPGGPPRGGRILPPAPPAVNDRPRVRRGGGRGCSRAQAERAPGGQSVHNV